jgi:uncharacterized protein GlcG (DUF336 family)
MKRPFTDEDAAALVDCAAKLAKTTATDEKGPGAPVAICCMVSQPDVMAVPTASRRMDGAKALSVTTASHKAFTVLAYGADTIKHANSRLVALAAHKMGYKTNFDDKGEPLDYAKRQ